jgi:hypothetical protein
VTVSNSIFQIHLVQRILLFWLITHSAWLTFRRYNWHNCISLIYILCFILKYFIWLLFYIRQKSFFNLLVFEILKKYYISSLLYLFSHISGSLLISLIIITLYTWNVSFVWLTWNSIFTLSRHGRINIILKDRFIKHFKLLKF